MKGEKKRTVLVSLVALIFVWGCAGGQKTFKTGEDLSQNKRWDEAIIFYEKALRDSPGNRKYQKALARAKQEAAKIHYGNAQQALSSDPDPSLPALDRIIKEAELAQSLDPKSITISKFCNNLRTKRDNVHANLKSLYAQAESDLKDKDWLAALTKLRKVNKIFPGFESSREKLAVAEEEGAKYFYKQGLALGKKEDWKMAAESFKIAMDINPNYYNVRTLYKEAAGKYNPRYFTDEAERASQAQDWKRAIGLYQKAVEYWPENQVFFDKLESLKTRVAQVYFDDAVKFANYGKLSQVVQKLISARTYAPSLAGGYFFGEFLDNLCEKLMNRAQEYSERNMWGNGLVWLQKIEALDPNYQDLFYKVLETKDHIKKRMKKSIAVFDFSSPSTDRDAGKIAANKLITFLHKNASGDLRIIERENLQSILREIQMGQTGLVDMEKAQEVGKMRGIDTFIMGDVLRFSSKSKDYPSTTAVKVLVGTEMISNPDFMLWLMQHGGKPSKEAWRNAPPREKEKKEYQFMTYRLGTTKIVALVEISYKLVSTQTGENLFANTISGKLVKEDKYQDGVPMANIHHDPLDLPTELEVLDELTDQKISEMGLSILKHFQSLEVEYFNQAQLHVKRRHYEDAVERYTDAIFDEKLKSISTPISQKASEMIDKLTENM